MERDSFPKLINLSVPHFHRFSRRSYSCLSFLHFLSSPLNSLPSSISHNRLCHPLFLFASPVPSSSHLPRPHLYLIHLLTPHPCAFSPSPLPSAGLLTFLSRLPITTPSSSHFACFLSLLPFTTLPQPLLLTPSVLPFLLNVYKLAMIYRTGNLNQLMVSLFPPSVCVGVDWGEGRGG